MTVTYTQIRFKAESGYLPDREMFISQDEIDKIITNGKNNHAYRLETYTYFVNHPDKADRIKYVGKDNQSGYLGGNDSVNKTTKGIEFSHGSVMEPYAKVLIKWSDVAKRIDTLIKQDKFVTQEDIDAIPDIYKNEITRDLESFFEGLSENDAKPYPNDIEPYKISRVIKAQLDNPQALDDIENMMSNALALMDKEDRMYQYRKQIYDDFVAYKNSTFKLYDYPNLAPKVKQPSKFTKPAEKEKVDAEIEPVVSEVDDGLDLIGEEIDIDGRHFVVDSVSNGYVSMADQTFANGSGFPIFRRETVEFVRQYLPTEKEQIISTQNTKQHTEHSQWDIHPEIPVEQRLDFDFAAHPVEIVGKKERFRRNMEAIKVLKECEADNRFATPDEQIVLSKYVGWGGIPEAFDENNSSWANEYNELVEVLSPDEYAHARESTLTAFFTPPEVINAVYKVMAKLGFKQGNILEPSCGVGNFIGMLPKDMQGSKFYGVELDKISASIAQQLYQNASVTAKPYEETDLPDSFFDAVVGNVPFGDFKVVDKRYDKNNFLIHDYFFAKSLDKLRAGGVMCLITSKGTMDKENPSVRKYIAVRAELLGAIRLPDNTFKGNAGTEVTSDILILQKRDRIVDIESDWIYLDTDENGIKMNSYFVAHPEMIIGEMVKQTGRFGIETACKAYEDSDFETLLDKAVDNIKGEIVDYDIIDEVDIDNSIPVDPTVRNFSYTLVDGKIYFRENSRMTPIDVSATAENRIRGMIALRDTVRSLITMQEQDYSEEEIKSGQLRLNNLYDKFIKDYGLISSRGNKSAFSQDSSYSLLSALEILDENGNLERKADMFTKRTIKPHKEITSVDTSSEALAVSIGEKASVDIEYMKSLTGKSEDEIYSDLQGVIFLNPVYSPNSSEPKYLPADEYLSGNVREKLHTAKENAEIYPELYTVNVKYLEKVQPKDLTASEISVRLGATWIPSEYIQEFVFELLEPSQYTRPLIKVHYFEYTGEWNIEGKSYDKGNVKAKNTYGSVRANAYNKEIATNVTFMKLRKEAESIVKNSSVYNNITIEKIYDCLNQVFDIDFDICQKLKSIEEKLLIDFSSARNFIKEIYDTAVKFNKKIIFIQNTYYNESTIINILKSNGITKFDNIFTASNKQFNEHLTNLLEFSINNLKINPYNILYFCSDNYNLELAQFLDIKSILIPKTTDKLNSYTLKSLPNSLINSNSFINSSGYDFTTSIIANKYFDNPFRSFTEGSAYNCDPYYLGSCALGMHLLSIIYWILKETTDYNKILFMARDGYLVKKAFDILVQTNKSKKKFPKTEYIHISRRLMMPYIISEYSDLLNFPSLNLFKATPKIMFDLLDFCTKDINKKDLSAFYNDINLSENTCFENKENYYKFIKELYVRFYDKKKHEQSKKALNEYFKNFNNNYITFDLGNYGRVQSAFVKATKKNIDALFLFSNTDVSIIESQKNNFKIKTFYEFYPNGNRSFREYIFSSDEPSCIGVVVSAFDLAIEYQTGRANIKTTALNWIKGFMAVSLFTITPIELYKFCVSLQNTFAKDLVTLVIDGRYYFIRNSGGKMKKQYIYPQNMRASATLWLWSLKDFVVVIIGALFSAIVLATTKLMIPAVLVGTYALLSIRADGTTMLDFIKYGIKFFISTQQYYEWGLKDETLPKQNKTKVGDENGKKEK